MCEIKILQGMWGKENQNILQAKMPSVSGD